MEVEADCGRLWLAAEELQQGLTAEELLQRLAVLWVSRREGEREREKRDNFNSSLFVE